MKQVKQQLKKGIVKIKLHDSIIQERLTEKATFPIVIIGSSKLVTHFTVKNEECCARRRPEEEKRKFVSTSVKEEDGFSN